MVATFKLMLLGVVTMMTFDSSLLFSTGAVTSQTRSEERQVIKATNSEEAVNETVKGVIDKLFRERKARAAFEQYFLFFTVSPDQQELIDESGSLFYAQKYAGLDEKTIARILAAKWNYEYKPALLVISTLPLSSGESFKQNLDRADSEIERQRKKVLSEHKLGDDEFYKLLDVDGIRDIKTLDHNLTLLEQIDADMTRYIERKTNQPVFAGNIAKMQEGFFVNKHPVGDHMLYEIQLTPMFKMLFLQQGAALKMVAFGDVL